MIISEQASGYGSMSYGNGHGHSCDHFAIIYNESGVYLPL